MMLEALRQPSIIRWITAQPCNTKHFRVTDRGSDNQNLSYTDSIMRKFLSPLLIKIFFNSIMRFAVSSTPRI